MDGVPLETLLSARDWRQVKLALIADSRLLDPAVEPAISALLAATPSDDRRLQFLVVLQQLTCRCRTVGVEAAFQDFQRVDDAPFLAEVLRPPVQPEDAPRWIVLLDRIINLPVLRTVPFHWAEAIDHLGRALFLTPAGSREANLELARLCFEAALEVWARETALAPWTETEGALGAVYLHRVRGDRSENLEEAIRRLSAVAEESMAGRHPPAWALAHGNLGFAYHHRLVGRRIENLEAAIRHCRTSIAAFRRLGLLSDWTSIQVNLALVYLDRIAGTPLAGAFGDRRAAADGGRSRGEH